MPAYIIADVEVTNPEIYEEYKKVVPQTISAYGGKYLVRGGEAEKLEGDWVPRRMVILEFESIERAKEWWASEDYKAPKALRQSAALTNLVIVEGV